MWPWMDPLKSPFKINLSFLNCSYQECDYRDIKVTVWVWKAKSLRIDTGGSEKVRNWEKMNLTLSRDSTVRKEIDGNWEEIIDRKRLVLYCRHLITYIQIIKRHSFRGGKYQISGHTGEPEIWCGGLWHSRSGKQLQSQVCHVSPRAEKAAASVWWHATHFTFCHDRIPEKVTWGRKK